MSKSRFDLYPLLPWTLLATGLLTTSLLTLRAIDQQRDHAVDQFTFACDQVVLKIEERLRHFQLALSGAAGLFAGADYVSREEWRAYVDKLDMESTLPGVQGIGFSQLVPATERDAHIQATRAQGFPDYQVWPAGERQVYSAIIYLEPFHDRNLRAFGYDMYSEPVRRLAMDEARDSNAAALTGKVELVQETGEDVQAGVLMYVPVYRNGMPTETRAQRRDALAGWAYSPYRMTDLLQGVLADWQSEYGQYLEFHIYDGELATSANELFGGTGDIAPSQQSPFYQQRLLRVHGRTWLAIFDRQPEAPAISNTQAWLTLSGGTISTGLLFLLVMALLRTEQRAERRAEDLTREIRQREQALEDSEFRWKFALEGSGQGVWDWNIPTATVYFSPLWKAMLGYQDAEIGTGRHEWENRLHPDDRAETLARVREVLEGNTTHYANEHRVQCKDGSYKWILDRGVVVSRDPGGKPLRMIGTHADISTTKALEQGLRNTRDELLEAQRIGRIGSWTLDLATDHVSWTAELYRMLGQPPDQPAPDYSRQAAIFTPDSWTRLSRAVAAAGEDGTPYSVELETVRDGAPLGWVLARGEAIRGADGSISGLRGTAVDITDRKLAENQIRRYASELEQLLTQTVALVTNLVEMRDPYTAGHEKRVAEIAVAIGSEMGLDKHTLEGLRVGGYLHDVGKIVVPAEILTKPGRLNALEYAIVQNHVSAGFDILKNVDFPWPVAQISYQHHERIDGTGYPLGLKGDEIQLEARIVAVADVVESMATDRPYRPALGVDSALAEIERGAGTAYDPAVVAACLRLFREQRFAIPQ